MVTTNIEKRIFSVYLVIVLPEYVLEVNILVINRNKVKEQGTG